MNILEKYDRLSIIQFSIKTRLVELLFDYRRDFEDLKLTGRGPVRVTFATGCLLEFFSVFFSFSGNPDGVLQPCDRH